MNNDPSLTCSVPVATLTSSPYSLAWGSDVYATVVAKNLYGESLESPAGNGDKVITNPDAPVNFSEDQTLRAATSLGLQWEEGTANGGTPVIDYEISYDEASGSTYVVLASNILENTYLVEGLTSGLTYKFKVKARNVFGLSAFSSELSLLAAYKPDSPNPPVTSVIDNTVVIDWTAPSNNGSPILSYRITWQ